MNVPIVISFLINIRIPRKNIDICGQLRKSRCLAVTRETTASVEWTKLISTIIFSKKFLFILDDCNWKVLNKLFTTKRFFSRSRRIHNIVIIMSIVKLFICNIVDPFFATLNFRCRWKHKVIFSNANTNNNFYYELLLYYIAFIILFQNKTTLSNFVIECKSTEQYSVHRMLHIIHLVSMIPV